MNILANEFLTLAQTEELVSFANHLADLSEPLVMKYFRQTSLEDICKSDDSPVSVADIEIEKLFRSEIGKKFPAHSISGEEFGVTKGNLNKKSLPANHETGRESHERFNSLKWHLDPIDGTSSFIIGKPIFTSLIAITYQDQPIFGLINQGITKERWQGGILARSEFNSKEIFVRKRDDLSEAILASSSPYFFDEKQRSSFDLVRSKTKYQKYGGVFLGGDAYLYAMLASGYIDCIMEAGLKSHDFLAPTAIIESSGGIVTDWSGKKINANSSGEILACGSSILHEKILELLALLHS